MSYHKILLAVPFQNINENTLQLAVEIAHQNDAQLTLFGVAEDIEKEYEDWLTTKRSDELLESMRSKYEGILKGHVARLKSTYDKVDCAVVSGIAFVEIVKKAAADHSDLLILDAVSTAHPHQRFMGSTTKHVLRKCPCAVLAVREKGKPSTVVAAVDVFAPTPEGLKLNGAIVRSAVEMAQNNGAKLHVVYAMQPVAEPMLSAWGVGSDYTMDLLESELNAKGYKLLNELIEKTVPQTLSCEASVIEGHPRDAIPAYVDQHNMDMIVLGTLCRTGIKGFLMGNTAESILADVKCSILALKPEGFQSTVA